MKDFNAALETPFVQDVFAEESPESARPFNARMVDESPFVREVVFGVEVDESEAVVDAVVPEGEDPGCTCDEVAPFSSDEAFFDEEAWSGSAEQIAFRDRVLSAHIARSRASRGAAKRDLRADELVDVPGTDVKTLPATAAAAGRLLAAVNADLAKAKQAGDPDAQRTVAVSATSGYRGSDHQRRLWLRYFSAKRGYYDRTQAAREKIAEGPHSEQAVAYMLRSEDDGGFGIGGRIAAPGYSNHQGGIAIDLWQERVKGQAIANASDKQSRKRWRATWVHAWLKANASTYDFKPIPTEEWHWEHRPASAPATATTAGPSSAPVDHLGGKLFAFTAKTLGTRVAVFCPKAALSRGEVDVLLFAHGLLGGCPRPGRVPEGFVTDAPFQLGRIVDRSGRPIVLVIPALDWANPGGENAFGAGRAKWHALALPRHLNAIVAEALAALGGVRSGASPSIGRLTIAGHSRAYDFLEPLAHAKNDPQQRQGALARLTEVWAFDTTYAGDPESWLDWLQRRPGLRVRMFYRPGTKTAAVGDRFYARRSDRLVVARVDDGHCAVPAARLPALLVSPGTVQGELDDEAEDRRDGEDPSAAEDAWLLDDEEQPLDGSGELDADLSEAFMLEDLEPMPSEPEADFDASEAEPPLA